MADPAPPSPATEPTPEPVSSKRKPPLPLLVGGVVLLVGGVFGVKQYVWSQTHLQTDDAYLTGNLVNVSPVVAGTLAELTVAEGDDVKPGQLLARLDADSQKAALGQAEAALATARANVPQAEASLEFQKRATAAAIQRARAAEAIRQSKTQGALAQVSLAGQTSAAQLAQASKQASAAEATARQADRQAESVGAQVTAARAGVATSQRAVESAGDAVKALEARLPAARAERDRAGADEARYESLLQKEAVTRQQRDSVHAQAEAARSALAALQAQIEGAKSEERRTKSVVAQANAQLAQARSARDASLQAARAAHDQSRAVASGIAVARAGAGQVAVRRSDVAASEAQAPQDAADLATARAGSSQIDARREAVRAAEAQVKQAEAAVQSAKKALANTTLASPTAGTVVKKTANVGASLAPGQTLLTLTRGSAIWVTANFKETQIGGLRLGQPAEIHVDAHPEKTYPGRVAVIGAATGATVSLLPPDNATGNFTKVVQRIPVKIAIEGNFPELHQGMSCVATVDSSDKTNHPEKVPAGWNGR